jgi:hypothetical protein
MKSLFVILIFLSTFLPFQASAQRELGVGVIMGDPIRITVKKWLGRDTAVDAAISRMNTGGGNNAESEAFEVHLDYLKHNFNMFQIKEGSLPVYYGIGVRIQNDTEMTTAVRIPIGISFLFKNAPVAAFYEYAFLFDMTTPDSEMQTETAFGIRYYF